MRLLFLALFLTFGLNCGALAQGPREVAFATVIGGQLTAFEQRDLVSAFSCRANNSKYVRRASAIWCDGGKWLSNDLECRL